MSTSTTAGGGNGGQQREMVYCHECRDEWFLDTHGLLCPACGSQFVEIMEDQESNPTMRSPRIPGGFDDSDDSHDGEDEHDHNHSGFSSTVIIEAPGIRIQRTTGNPLLGMNPALGRPGVAGTGEAGQAAQNGGPNMVELLQSIFSSIMGEQGVERARQQQHPHPQGPQEPGAHTWDDSTGVGTGIHTPPDPRRRADSPHIAQLGSLFGNGLPPQRFVYAHTVPPTRAGGAVQVDDLQGFLQSLFGRDTGAGMIHQLLAVPGVGPGGDYVWSEGQLDRVLSELMEQHQGNAPPPAPPEVLNNLPKIKVDQKRVLEGEDCSVCKEDLILDEDVAQLPCKHVYHEGCIKRWLESRDTCPVCRASTAAAMQGQQQQPQPPQQQQQTPPQQQQQQQQEAHHQNRRSWFSRSSATVNSNTNTNNNNNNNNNSNGNSSSSNPAPSVPWAWGMGGGNNNGNSR